MAGMYTMVLSGDVNEAHVRCSWEGGGGWGRWWWQYQWWWCWYLWWWWWWDVFLTNVWTCCIPLCWQCCEVGAGWRWRCSTGQSSPPAALTHQCQQIAWLLLCQLLANICSHSPSEQTASRWQRRRWWSCSIQTHRQTQTSDAEWCHRNHMSEWGKLLLAGILQAIAAQGNWSKEDGALIRARLEVDGLAWWKSKVGEINWGRQP